MGWEWVEGREIRALEPVWRAAGAAAPHTIFQTFELAEAWIATHGDAGVFFLVDEEGPALLALVEREGELRPLGEGLFDYIAPVGMAADGRLTEAAALVRRRGWGVAQCTGVRAPGPGHAFWRALPAAAEPYAAAPKRRAAAGDPEPEHPRTAMRWRRAQAGGITYRLEPDAEARLASLEWMLARKRAALAQRGEDNVLGPEAEAWLRRLVVAWPALSEVWTLRDREERPLAGLLSWRHGGERLAYTICFESRAAAMSPGVLLLYAVLRWTMWQRLNFDFMTGEQPFKLRFASHSESLLRYRGQRATHGH